MITKSFENLVKHVRKAFTEFPTQPPLSDSSEQASKTEALENLLQNPCGHFRGYSQGNYVWPAKQGASFFLEDIYVVSRSFPIGYIQGIAVNCSSRTAIIQHFAVESDLVNMGLGRVMAYALYLNLLSRYGVRKIIFSENSTKYLQGNYPEFFSSLKAVPVEVPMQTRPDWHWEP